MINYVVAVIVGVLIAFFSFIMKEALVYIWQGIRFRRRLVEDIKMMIQHYDDEYPEINRLRSVLSASEQHASFIWESSVEGERSFAENFVHLMPLEAAYYASFFDAISRLDKVRDEYNRAVRGVIIDCEKLPRYLALINACLDDMDKEYAELIKVGSECLLELSRNRWFLKIDPGRFAELVKKYASRASNT